MWTKESEAIIKELGFTEKQIELLSDKSHVGISIVTSVLLEAVKQGLVITNNKQTSK